MYLCRNQLHKSARGIQMHSLLTKYSIRPFIQSTCSTIAAMPVCVMQRIEMCQSEMSKLQWGARCFIVIEKHGGCRYMLCPQTIGGCGASLSSQLTSMFLPACTLNSIVARARPIRWRICTLSMPRQKSRRCISHKHNVFTNKHPVRIRSCLYKITSLNFALMASCDGRMYISD